MREFFQRFEWDEQTLTYRRVSLLSWKAIRSIPRVFFWGLLLGVGLTPLTYYSLWERYILRSVEKNIVRIRQAQQAIQAEISEIDKQRQVLYERMQKFYRPLLGMAPLSPETWNGGMGGAATTPEELPLYQTNLLLAEYLAIEKHFAEMNARLDRMPCIMPVNGPIVSGFGMRADPFTRQPKFHEGIDIDAPLGAPVRAAAAGRVITADWNNGGYGLEVEIDHFNGIVTKYAHLSKVAVKRGDLVTRGQIIGYVGSTGYSTGPHLHYEVIENGIKVNPEKYILIP